MIRLKLFATIVAASMVPGAALAQSYGATDPAFADTTDPNSAPLMQGYRAQGYRAQDYRAQTWHTHPGYGTHAYSPSSRGYDSTAYPQRSYGTAYPQRGYGHGAYASGGHWHFNDSQSGGNGSPVAAGSLRGSTDRSSPNAPIASGPDGAGERHGVF